MNDLNHKICPRCGSRKMKTWNELSDDEKILIQKIPGSSEKKREKLWCARCFYEFDAERQTIA